MTNTPEPPTARHPSPSSPGFYWAKWRIAADGTREGDELTPSDEWEVVQVNENTNGSPGEELSVAVPGVEMTQWPDCFIWGPGPLEMPRLS